MNILVVPTIRENSIQTFLKSWISDWDMVLIIEDNENKTFDISSHNVIHYCWQDIEKDLKENSWIISRKDSGIRCYGLWKAHQLGADYIFTLDDDCLPTEKINGKFCALHLQQLKNTKKWTDSILGFRTRGMPYYNLGTLNNVVCNMGLWENVPDLDCIHALANKDNQYYFEPQFHNRIMPQNQYFPLCGMNVSFTREVIPLCYVPLSGKDSPYGRFDDIFFGIIFKKICDHLNLLISCGEPVINHCKASNYMANLAKEAPSIVRNETFWELIDNIKLTNNSPKSCIFEMGDQLKDSQDNYIAQLGVALKLWSNLF